MESILLDVLVRTRNKILFLFIRVSPPELIILLILYCPLKACLLSQVKVLYTLLLTCIVIYELNFAVELILCNILAGFSSDYLWALNHSQLTSSLLLCWPALKDQLHNIMNITSGQIMKQCELFLELAFHIDAVSIKVSSVLGFHRSRSLSISSIRTIDKLNCDQIVKIYTSWIMSVHCFLDRH